jgi:hypothetical protein
MTMSNIRMYTVGDSHWLGVEINGKVFLITWLAYKGNLIQSWKFKSII